MQNKSHDITGLHKEMWTKTQTLVRLQNLLPDHLPHFLVKTSFNKNSC